jgi:hypothetical protein
MLHLHFQGDHHSVSIRFQISLVLIIFLFRLSVFEIVSSHIYFLGGYTKKGIFGLAQKSYSFGLGKESCGFLFIAYRLAFLFGFGYTFVFSVPRCHGVLADFHGWQSLYRIGE